MNTNTTSMATNGTGSGNFSGYVENSTGAMNIPNIPPRQTPSPSPSHNSVTTQINGGGMGAMGAAIPMNAGHQMDLHHLYEMVVELSDVLKNNRDVTKKYRRECGGDCGMWDQKHAFKLDIQLTQI
jgi:hypothetical protein